MVFVCLLSSGLLPEIFCVEASGIIRMYICCFISNGLNYTDTVERIK